MPEELSSQLPLLHELLAAWGISVFDRENYEADDVMATMGRLSEGVVDRVWYYTGDKDFMQLLDVRSGMLKPGKRGTELTEFTADDVWELIDGTDVGTHENRAMGPVMRAASKAMIIQRTDRTIKTRRPSRNRGDVRVCRSLIYSGGQND